MKIFFKVNAQAFILLLQLGFFSSLTSEQLSIPIKAESAILINAETKEILYEKNARSKQFPASITKIATAAYAIKTKGDQLNAIITAEQESIASISSEAKRRSNFTLPAYWIEFGSSHIGIKKGEKLSFKDLLYGMMLATANDAANVIAQFAGGTIPDFMVGLNSYVQDMGCKDTCFMNPSGLHHPKHQTTAYDMALISCEALKNPLFREIVKTVRYTRPKTNMQEPVALVQTNRLLRSGEFYYPKAIGVKTGKTTHAKNTIVAAAKDGDRTLVAVLLNVKERNDIFKESIKLFDAAFNQPKIERTLIKPGKQKYALEIEGALKPISTYVTDKVSLTYYPAEEPKIKAFLTWEDVKLPIKKDQKVGALNISSNGNVFSKQVPLYAEEDVDMTLSYKLAKIISKDIAGSPVFKIAGIVIFIVLLGFILLNRQRTQRRF